MEDFDDMIAMWGDEAVTRYVGGRPFARQEVWCRLLQYVGLWHLLGYGYWVVEERLTGTFLGEVGFAEYQRELVPSIVGVREAGWCFSSRAHGYGFATEAIQAALEWNDKASGGTRTVCLIDPENLASLRVANGCGFAIETCTHYRGKPTLLFSRLRFDHHAAG